MTEGGDTRGPTFLVRRGKRLMVVVVVQCSCKKPRKKEVEKEHNKPIHYYYYSHRPLAMRRVQVALPLFIPTLCKYYYFYN
jgi:hypothetical protein